MFATNVDNLVKTEKLALKSCQIIKCASNVCGNLVSSLLLYVLDI